MKKYILSFGLIIAFAIYIALEGHGSSLPSSGIALNGTAGTGATTPAQTGAGSNPPSPAGSGTPNATPSAGQFKNGSYTGSPADAYFGTVQVEAIVSKGQLTNVKILQAPSDTGHSIEVSQIALPYLIQEAVSAQSANVSAVSGATQTSGAFMQSLASALSQARS